VGSPQILIVEENEELARDLAAQTIQLGYRVCGIANNVLQAMALGKSLQPDIVLVNSALVSAVLIGGRLAYAGAPDVSNSLELPFVTPAILLIASDDKPNIKFITRAAKHGYLTRPFQLRELRAAIEVALYKARLEQRLRTSERWFADTLHCVNDGVIAVDTAGNIRFINLAAERILGTTLELAENRKIEEILHFEDKQHLSADEVLRTGSTFDIEFGKWILNANAERLPVDHSAAPIRDESDQLIGAVVVIRDASTRVAAEGELRFSEECFRIAFEQAPEGMALVTLDGRFIQGNPAICHLLKCDEIELQALNISDIAPPEDRFAEKQRLTSLIIGTVSSLQFEHRILPLNGEPILVQVSVSLLQRSEAPFCYLYQVHDLTARNLAESLERQQQSMNKIHASTIQEKQIAQAANISKGAFIASMAHELRTPLNAILGFSQLLENETASTLTSDQRNSVENIRRAGWHLLELINDTLDLEKIESGMVRLLMEDIDLGEMLSECMLFISTKASELHVVVSASSNFNFIVNADRVRMRQVILNLLSNAVKYNRENGSVTVACSQQHDRVRIAITDTGPGLSVEQQAHLFEPFNRLGKESGNIEGSGIGLVITKSLMESMHGAIGVDSYPGNGCVFWVEFAVGSASKTIDSNIKQLAEDFSGTLMSAPVPPFKPASPSATSAAISTILYIEDNPVNMLLVKKILQQRPAWRLITATTGESGFELALSANPDLILLDISLPDVSGLELIQRLRGNFATQAIPVVAVSANAGPQYIQEALAQGFNCYITKPFRLPEFLQTIETLLSDADVSPELI